MKSKETVYIISGVLVYLEVFVIIGVHTRIVRDLRIRTGAVRKRIVHFRIEFEVFVIESKLFVLESELFVK